MHSPRNFIPLFLTFIFLFVPLLTALESEVLGIYSESYTPEDYKNHRIRLLELQKNKPSYESREEFILSIEELTNEFSLILNPFEQYMKDHLFILKNIPQEKGNALAEKIFRSFLIRYNFSESLISTLYTLYLPEKNISSQVLENTLKKYFEKKPHQLKNILEILKRNQGFELEGITPYKRKSLEIKEEYEILGHFVDAIKDSVEDFRKRKNQNQIKYSDILFDDTLSKITPYLELSASSHSNIALFSKLVSSVQVQQWPYQPVVNEKHIQEIEKRARDSEKLITANKPMILLQDYVEYFQRMRIHFRIHREYLKQYADSMIEIHNKYKKRFEDENSQIRGLLYSLKEDRRNLQIQIEKRQVKNKAQALQKMNRLTSSINAIDMLVSHSMFPLFDKQLYGLFDVSQKALENAKTVEKECTRILVKISEYYENRNQVLQKYLKNLQKLCSERLLARKLYFYYYLSFQEKAGSLNDLLFKFADMKPDEAKEIYDEIAVIIDQCKESRRSFEDLTNQITTQANDVKMLEFIDDLSDFSLFVQFYPLAYTKGFSLSALCSLERNAEKSDPGDYFEYSIHNSSYDMEKEFNQISKNIEKFTHTQFKARKERIEEELQILKHKTTGRNVNLEFARKINNLHTQFYNTVKTGVEGKTSGKDYEATLHSIYLELIRQTKTFPPEYFMDPQTRKLIIALEKTFNKVKLGFVEKSYDPKVNDIFINGKKVSHPPQIIFCYPTDTGDTSIHIDLAIRNYRFPAIRVEVSIDNAKSFHTTKFLEEKDGLGIFRYSFPPQDEREYFIRFRVDNGIENKENKDFDMIPVQYFHERPKDRVFRLFYDFHEHYEREEIEEVFDFISEYDFKRNYDLFRDNVEEFFRTYRNITLLFEDLKITVSDKTCEARLKWVKTYQDSNNFQFTKKGTSLFRLVKNEDWEIFDIRTLNGDGLF